MATKKPNFLTAISEMQRQYTEPPSRYPFDYAPQQEERKKRLAIAAELEEAASRRKSSERQTQNEDHVLQTNKKGQKSATQRQDTATDASSSRAESDHRRKTGTTSRHTKENHIAQNNKSTHRHQHQRRSRTASEHRESVGSPHRGSITMSLNYSYEVVAAKMRKLPDSLKTNTNLFEKTVIVNVLYEISKKAKSHDHLVFGIENCDNYYKVFCSNYRERISMDMLFFISTVINKRVGWLVIRDLYIEGDTRRIVAEVNKESVKRYVPPLQEKIKYHESIMNTGTDTSAVENTPRVHASSTETAGTKRGISEIDNSANGADSYAEDGDNTTNSNNNNNNNDDASISDENIHTIPAFPPLYGDSEEEEAEESSEDEPPEEAEVHSRDGGITMRRYRKVRKRRRSMFSAIWDQLKVDDDDDDDASDSNVVSDVQSAPTSHETPHGGLADPDSVDEKNEKPAPTTTHKTSLLASLLADTSSDDEDE